MLPLEITAGNATLGVSANPRLGWSPKPGSADVNVDGYRDRVFPTAKPAGTFRIEVLGDPVTFGARVTSRDDTFAKVMERGLDRLLGGVEVLNLRGAGLRHGAGGGAVEGAWRSLLAGPGAARGVPQRLRAGLGGRAPGGAGRGEHGARAALGGGPPAAAAVE